jgi:hypothetical protein
MKEGKKKGEAKVTELIWGHVVVRDIPPASKRNTRMCVSAQTHHIITC